MDPARDAVGLCLTCRYARRIENRRGSTFMLCEKSVTEPDRFSRYPPLPVLACRGYELDGPSPHGPEKKVGGER